MGKKEAANDDSKKRHTVEENLQKKRTSDVEQEYYNSETTKLSEVNEPAVSYGKHYYTIEEYLEMERASHVKHEYYQGEVFAMSGASDNHNFIFSNVFGGMFPLLRKHGCRPLGSDMRMHIPENTLYTYPDISIYCGQPTTTDENRDTAVNPTIIIEILSKSTRNYDRGIKFKLYRDIPTLKEYVLIDSENTGVDVWHVDTDKNWACKEYKTLEETVLIPTVDVSLSMQDIYNGTTLFKPVKIIR